MFGEFTVQRYDIFLGYAKEILKELDSKEICLKKGDFLKTVINFGVSASRENLMSKPILL